MKTRILKIQAPSKNRALEIKKQLQDRVGINADHPVIEVKSNCDTVLNLPAVHIKRGDSHSIIESHYYGIWLSFFDEE